MANGNTMKLKRLSVCPCGYGTLQDEIKLGTEYRCFPRDTDPVQYTCGGCGNTTHLTAFRVERNGTSGYLPVMLFEGRGEMAIKE